MTPQFQDQVLTVIVHKRFWHDAEGYKTQGGFGKQIEAFAPYFRQVILAVPVREEPTVQPGYRLSAPNLTVYPLAYFGQLNTWRARLQFFLHLTPYLWWQTFAVVRRADIIHPRLPGYIALYGIVAARLLRKPLFVYVGGDWAARVRSEYESLLRWLVGGLLAWFQRRALHKVLVFQLPGVSLRSGDWHSIFTTTLDADSIMGPVAIKSSLGTPARILYVGRLSAEKGVTQLVPMLAALRKQGHEVVLDLVGEGDLRPPLEAQIAATDLENVVSLHGYVPLGASLMALYQRADIFVLPSLVEGMGKVLLEAMAAGLPIVATRVGGIPHLITHGENGLLVPPQDSEALADAVASLLDQAALRQQLSRAGLMVARRYTLENLTSEMLAKVWQSYHEH